MSGNKSSSWHDYNESLIERGRVLIDVGFLKSANVEIKKINEDKVGAPFQYSDSYIQFLAFLKIGFKIPYRTVQGIIRGLADYIKIEERIKKLHTMIHYFCITMLYKKDKVSNRT